MRKLIVCLAVLSCTFSLGVTPAAAADAAGSTPELDASAIVDAGAPGAVVTAWKDGTWSNTAAGYAQIESKSPADANDEVRIGSITKPMVATVVMQLVQKGQLGLDDSISKYLPGVVPDADKITIRNLLNHTSGLPDYVAKLYTSAQAFVDDAAKPLTPQQLIQVAMTGEPAQTVPGTWSYSNTNYVIAGLIVEKVTGQPISEALRDRVFLPAGMNHTILRAEDPNLSGPHMDGYVIQPGTNTAPYNATNYTPTLAFSAGAVISTTADVNRFFHALFSGKLVSATTLEEMKATVPSDDPAVRYGLGIIRYDVPGAPGGVLWGHDGSIAGFNSLGLTTSDGASQVATAANVYAVLVPDVIQAEMELATKALTAPQGA